ncbi:MAG: peptidoglycan-binding domain-containing protein [Cyanobacteriota bacterium]|nr:peptidoglycan-binding domain-containing protein [Cyanobacteriota bacterium]
MGEHGTARVRQRIGGLDHHWNVIPLVPAKKSQLQRLMMVLQKGSFGPDVRRLQEQLGQLGFYAGKLDSDFGAQTDLALRDFQRRLGFFPDGKVAAVINQAIQSALGSPIPGANSCFQAFKTIQDNLFAQKAADANHLAFLDRGIDEVKPGDYPSLPKRTFPESPFKKQIPNYPFSLRVKPDGLTLVAPADPAGLFQAYPLLGQRPAFESGGATNDTLAFLSDEIQQACLCLGRFDLEKGVMQARWFGRSAFHPVQFWSATKYLSPIFVVCQANKKNPLIKIPDCKIHQKNSMRLPSDPGFEQLFLDMVSYRKGVARSNAVGLMFKRLCNPGEPNIQQWLSALTGSAGLQFLGGYGVDPFIFQPELYASSGPLVTARDPGSSSNRVSAYDLVRVITMLGWHHSLVPAARLPGAQWHSLSSLVCGLGSDTARYLDVALRQLRLDQVIQSPVILSKLGFGTLNQGTDALTTAAFVQFIDPRSTPRILRSFAFALRLPTSAAQAPNHDAKMASEITELVRRVVADAWS